MKEKCLEQPTQEEFEKSKYSSIRSVDDAEKRLSSWDPNNKSTEDFPNYVVDCFDKDSNIFGTSSEYHNLSSEFARKSLYKHAEIIAGKGASKYKYNVDLLADIVKFGSQCQDWEHCRDAYERLLSIEYKKWSWRTFTFVIDYLFDKMELSDQDEATSINEIEKLIANYKKLNDERAWVAEADLFLKQGKRKAAIESLKNGVKKVAVAPQCCIKLSDLLLEDGEYKEVIKYSAIGIRGTAQDQPSASNGFLLYASALAKDALIHKEEIENINKETPDTGKGVHNLIAVKDALMDYRIAKQLLQGRTIFLSNITQREIILKVKSEIDSEEAVHELLTHSLRDKLIELSGADNKDKTD